MDAKGPNNAVETVANIVAAYVSNNALPTTELANLIVAIHDIVAKLDGTTPAAARSEPLRPAVPVKRSITDDYLICLEDGRKFKSLKRHLRTRYNMTPEQYRTKWQLSADYPMVAPAYAETRSRMAKDMGLGQQRRKKRKS